MKLKLIIISAIFFLFCNFAQGSEIKWYSYQEGVDMAKKEGKMVYIYFYTDWCPYCKIMEKNTLKNEGVIEYLAKSFISVRINTDKERDIPMRYGVRGLPSNVFLSKEEALIGSRPGYIETDVMLKVLQYLQKEPK
ncbi:MAG: thioredoxin fold domain-containing protein [Desulfobacterales bacterium]|nr:thioredoxin fold domain-containing protein [Desulfobacterales bacterium]